MQPLTPEQKDALATFCGWTLIVASGDGCLWPMYQTPSGKCPHRDGWQPDTSRDDCWPILQRIEELGLWEDFMAAIAVQDWLRDNNGLWIEIYSLMPPSVVVAAVLELIEKGT